MKRLLVFAVFIGLWVCSGAGAKAQDDQYVPIYNLIQEADALNSSGQPAAALAKYTEARTDLQNFERLYPNWNTSIVHFRLSYLDSRIDDLTAKLPPPAAAAPPPNKPAAPTNAPPAGSAQMREQTELQAQLAGLQNQVRQLQSDKELLQAKLKEALSAQPASVDPRELAKAQAKIETLEKENSLLQVSLTQQQVKSAPADLQALDQLRSELAESNRKYAQESDKAKALALERQALQAKLNAVAAAEGAGSQLDAARNALSEANRKLAEQALAASKLSHDKENLEARLKTMDTSAADLAALQAENELLRRQVASLKQPAAVAPAATAAAPAANPLTQKLAEAQAQIAMLQSDKEILSLEKTALQDRVKSLSTPPASGEFVSAAVAMDQSSRIRQMERERAELLKQLDAAQKELYGRKRKSVTARINDLTGQLQALRARVAVYEAQQAPYSAEELALFNAGQGAPAAADTKPAPAAPADEIPAGTATLVAEARQDFAEKKFDQAQEKYMQVLKKDENNVFTLANLATIQLQTGLIDDAEKHIQQALAINPDDAYSLSVLGQIKFQRKQYDEALTALSRAAKLDPQNPEIQNYLGLVLSEKGMRHPAEAAFRKAIELDPRYGSAHYNLAVFYITQDPPWPELARWHYKKALDIGFPRSPDLEKMLDAKAAETADK